MPNNVLTFFVIEFTLQILTKTFHIYSLKMPKQSKNIFTYNKYKQLESKIKKKIQKKIRKNKEKLEKIKKKSNQSEKKQKNKKNQEKSVKIKTIKKKKN